MKWTWFTVVMLVIVIGLILRFGKTSTTLAKDAFSGFSNWFSVLSLQKFQGNTP